MADVRTRSHPLKIFHPRIHTNLRKRLFSVLSHWNSLLSEIVLAPSLSQFKRLLAVHFGGQNVCILNCIVENPTKSLQYTFHSILH